MNIARKCGKLNFLSEVPILLLINLKAIEGENSLINPFSDFVASFPAFTSIGITSPFFSITNSSSKLSFDL